MRRRGMTAGKSRASKSARPRDTQPGGRAGEARPGAARDRGNRPGAPAADPARDRFRSSFEHAAVGIAHTTAGGDILQVNRSLCEMLGYSRDELLARNTRELAHPDDRQDEQPLELLSGRRRHGSGEKRYLRKDGSVAWVNRTVALVRGAPGVEPYLVQTIEDITERKRTEERLRRADRARRVLAESNHAQVHATDESSFLNDICRILVESGGYVQAWVGYAQDDERKSILPVASAGFEPGYLERKPRYWADDGRDPSLTGLAIARGKPYISRDIFSDPNSRHLVARARLRGYQSMIGLPLRVEGRCIAGISIYAREADAFDPDEIALLTTLADDVAFGIASLRADAAHRQAAAQLKRLSRARKVMAECNRVLVHASDEQRMLEEMCRVAVDSGGYNQAWIGAPTGDPACPVRAAAHAGYGGSAPMKAGATWTVDGRYQGLAGEALAAGEVRIVRDVLNDPRHERLRRRALELGFQSSIALPLTREGRRFGVFVLHATERDAFDGDEIALLTGLAGDIAFGVATLRGRAAREQAEQRLRESERRVREMFDQAAVGITRTSLDGVMVEVNQKFCDMLGYAREELIGRSARDITHPDDFGKGELFREQLRGGVRPESRVAEKRYVRKDGTPIWTRRSLSAAYDDGGKPRYVVSVIEDITQQKDLERRFELTFDCAAVGMALGSLDGRYIRVNKAFADMVGYSGEELAGLPVGNLIPEEDRGGLDEVRGKLTRGELNSVTSERRYLRKDGVTVWANRTLSLVRDAAGEPLYYIGVTEDVTERKAVEERYRATFDNAPVGIMHTAMDGYRILRANRKLCEMLGYTQEELLGMTSTQVVHPDYRFTDKSRYTDQLVNGAIQSFASERKFVRRDGTPIWVNRTVSLVRDASGRPEYFIRVIEDISERKRAEEAVARERALLRTVVDAVPDRIYVKDREGRYLLQNMANARAHGVASPEELLGKTIFDVLPREAAERIEAEDRRILTSGAPVFERERLNTDPAGEKRWVTASKLPLRDERGEIIGIVGVNRDITARKRAEEAVRQSQQFLEKAQEVAHIGHWVSDPQRADGKLYWSKETHRIFGLTEEQFDGRVETFFNLVHPDDRDVVAKASSAALAGGRPYSIDHRVIRPDGAVRWIHEEADVIRDADGRPLQMVGVSQDITERMISARRREMEHAVTGVLAESPTLEAAMPRLIRTMCEAMEWAYGARWVCDERGEVLRRLECWSDFPMDFDPADAAQWTRQDIQQSGAGRLLRRAWSRKEPTWLEDIQQTGVRRQPSARKFGLHSAFAFPIVVADRAIGIMEFFGREVRQPDEMLLQVARSIGSQIGQFIQRKQAENALRASEERLKVIFDTEPECVKVVSTDGVLLDMNPAGLAMVEADRRERVVGKVIADLVHPLDREAFIRLNRTAARGASGSLQFRLIGLCGTLRWVETNSVPLRDSAGKIGSVLSVTRDITARKKAEAALHESEEQFRQLANNIPQVFWMTDVEQKQLIYVSPGYEEISGQSIEQVKASPRTWLDAVHPEDRDRIKQARRRAVESTYDETFRLVRPDGAVRWVHDRAFPVHDDSGAVYRIAGIAEDVTERKLAEERLMQLAHYDVLTSLPNRVLFYDRLKQALAQARRNQWTVGILFIDVDRFKNVNDTLGHAVGDKLLQQVSERLTGAVRADDTVGRLGGDEFAIVLTRLASPQDANLVAQKIMASFNGAFQLDGSEVYVTASIGITLFPDDSVDQDTLIKNADAAMYRAKEVGRNTYQFYTPEMNTRAVEMLGMENSLRRALERDEFLLYFQPKASIADGAMVGVEALLRWRHPERGLVSPGEFMPVLEETGLIMAVGDWVIHSACAQIKAWQAAGIEPVPIAINLSARQFQSHTLGARIVSAIEEAGIAPHLLEVEITESSLMQNAEGATSTLHYLKSYGLRISIDDFGTGYSSLAYLKRFPLDALKIDRSFVRDVTTDGDDATITRAVISMAHSLGLRVIAEGVETEAQLGFLAEYGCDEIQGYYLSRPMPAADCGAWLREKRGLSRSPQAAEAAPAVLLVDDDDDALALLRRTLGKDGYRILSARNAHEALELLGKHRVDVVISDQNMPGIPGTEFLQRAKSLSPKTVRMMISGQTDFRTMSDAVNKGEIFRFLHKGTAEDRLRADVREALRARTEAAATTGQHAAAGTVGK